MRNLNGPEGTRAAMLAAPVETRGRPFPWPSTVESLAVPGDLGAADRASDTGINVPPGRTDEP